MSQPLESYVPELTVTAAGRNWRLRRADNFDSLWDGMVADGRADAEEHIPYWTELWPSSIALSQWLVLNRERIAGHPCLDLGCGLGLTALVASWLGARVMGIDYEEEALHYAALNAELNGLGHQPLWVAMDWRRPALAPSSVQYLWGGDIMYERRFVGPVLRFCAHALAPGGKVWVAEPGRSVYDFFLAALPDFGWRGRKVHEASVQAIYAQACPVRVAIWELERE